MRKISQNYHCYLVEVLHKLGSIFLINPFYSFNFRRVFFFWQLFVIEYTDLGYYIDIFLFPFFIFSLLFILGERFHLVFDYLFSILGDFFVWQLFVIEYTDLGYYIDIFLFPFFIFSLIIYSWRALSIGI